MFGKEKFGERIGSTAHTRAIVINKVQVQTINYKFLKHYTLL